MRLRLLGEQVPLGRLDFIDSYRDRPGIQRALAEVGFFSEKDRYFKNASTKVYLEFPPGPVMIGNELAKAPVDWETPAGKIRMLSPTDCVKDRLAKFYSWDDTQALYQVLLVVAAQPVNLREVERWSIQNEGEKERYKFFRTRSITFRVEVLAVPGSPMERGVPLVPVSSLKTSAVCPAVSRTPSSDNRPVEKRSRLY